MNIITSLLQQPHLMRPDFQLPLQHPPPIHGPPPTRDTPKHPLHLPKERGCPSSPSVHNEIVRSADGVGKNPVKRRGCRQLCVGQGTREGQEDVHQINMESENIITRTSVTSGSSLYLSDCIVADPNDASWLDFISNKRPPPPNIFMHVSTSQLASASDIIPREPTQPLGDNRMVGTSSRPSSSNAGGVVSPKRKPNKRPRVDSGMDEGAEKDSLGDVEMKTPTST